MVREKFTLIFETERIKDHSNLTITKDINVLKNLTFGNINVKELQHQFICPHLASIAL